MVLTNVLEFLKWTAAGTAVAALASYFAPHVHRRFSKNVETSQEDKDGGVSRSDFGYLSLL